MATAPLRPRHSHRHGGARGWPFVPRGRNRRQRGVGSGPVAVAVDPAVLTAVPSVAAAGGPTRLHRWLAILLPLSLTVAGGLAIAAGLLAGHRFLTGSPHFSLREFRASGARHLKSDALLARAGIALGDNLFTVSIDDVVERLRADPWVAAVRVHRELPAALAVEVEEREAAAVVALGSLYLCDRQGAVFKRASVAEAASLPVLTGPARDAYIHDRDGTQALIREGLAALWQWQAGLRRPAIGEIHIEPAAGTTLYLKQGGTAIRIGHGEAGSLAARMVRVDAVLAALSAAGQRPIIIHADAAVHPERVTVRLASPRRSPPPLAAVDPDAKN